MKNMLVKLCFSLHFIPLDPDPHSESDPDPRTQMNANPTGSGYTSLNITSIISAYSQMPDIGGRGGGIFSLSLP